MDDHLQDTSQGIVWATLPPEAEQQLLQVISPLFPKRFTPHITLAYKVTRQDFERLQPGVLNSVQTIKVTGWATDGSRIQAAIIDLTESGLKSNNPISHITISAQEFVKPVESNAMLQSPSHQEWLKEPLQLPVQIEFYPFPPK